MIRALFFDLDGTLLSSSKTLLPSSYAALQALKARGVRIFFATARSPGLDRMFQWSEREFSLFDGCIYCNGAYVMLDSQIIHRLIEPAAVERCVREVARYADIHIALHTQDDCFALNHILPDCMLSAWGVTRERTYLLNGSALPPAIKILIYTGDLVDASKALPHRLYTVLSAAISDRANVYLTDQGRTLQIISKESGKFAAIDHVRKSLGLNREEIAVFGDDVNDVEMLSGFPCSVAMGNGAPQAQKAAAYITRSNDDDGIAYALRELLHLF